MTKIEPFSYETATAPKGYQCTKCHKPEKLWRQYQTCASAVELLCASCAEDECQNKPSLWARGEGDQIGWLVPAVPTEDGETFWGYTSVPARGCAWWRSLPPRAEPFVKQAMEVAQEQDRQAAVAKEEQRHQHDQDIAVLTAATVYVVEATSFERQCLWESFSSESSSNRIALRWEQQSSGVMETIGMIDNRPVCVSIFFVFIERHVVAFVDATSQVVDHVLVDQWRRKTFKRAQSTDAMNFHNCVHHIKALNNEADAAKVTP